MSRIGINAPLIVASMAFAPKSWTAPEYHWYSYPSSPGGKQSNAAAIKRQAKKRRTKR